MSEIGTVELLFIAFVALVFLGPERMSELTGMFRKGVKCAHHTINEIKKEINVTEELTEVEKDIKNIKKDLVENCEIKDLKHEIEEYKKVLGGKK